MKKFAIIILIALAHFGLSVLVVAAAMSVATDGTAVQPELSPVFRILVAATRVLHFPIISLSLYSRHWFPGKWIYVPIGVNSLLWGMAIYFSVAIGLKLKKSHDSRKHQHTG